MLECSFYTGKPVTHRSPTLSKHALTGPSPGKFRTRSAFVRRAARSLLRRYGNHQAMELVYRDLFVRELARLGIEDRFFPVASAANHSLLYLVLRCYVELPLQRILDVGAGQTSLLLHALQKKMGKAEVITLEHDASWAAHIAAQVDHQVLRRDLVPLRVDHRTTQMHALTDLPGRFQLIIMDGPPGVRRHSRLGLLALMRTVMDHDGFVAILDDADRAGEWQTAEACWHWLHDQGITFRHAEIRAAKHQWLCAGGALQHAVFF